MAHRHSEWLDGDALPPRPPLSGTREVDVAVVGGGITGVTAALALAEAGRHVALVEARRLGFGVTGHTSAHLTALPDTPFSELELGFGADGARAIWNLQMDAVAHIEREVAARGIDCGFARVPGFLFAEDEDGAAFVAEQARVADRLGIPVDRVTSPPLPFPVAAAVCFEDQARFHPIRYVAALTDRLVAAGGEVYEGTRAVDVEVGDRCTVTTSDGALRARHVLIATHSPIGLILSVHTRVAGYRSYCLSVEVDDPPDGLFWDTADPYHYVRRHGDRLVVGGEDHKTGHGRDLAERWDRLEAWTRARFDVKRVVNRWSGQVFEPADGLPYVGRLPTADNVLFATGFSGNGLTLGTAAGRILSDLVLDRPTPHAALLDPRRARPAAAMPRFAKENADVAFRFVRDRLTRSEARSLDDIPRGEGRLVRISGRKVAAYRGDDGALTTLSAVCPHAGCIVQWNGAEQSWDCPCHASRFACTGEVLDGPATRDLTRVGESATEPSGTT